MDRVEKSIRVGSPIDVVYGSWRNFESFPSFMEYVEDVQVTGPNTSHWKIKEPTGSLLEYDAEISADEPNRTIGWRSTGGDMGTSGTVNFTEIDPQTTLVHVVMQWYDVPGGAIGEAPSHLFRDPESMVENDLRRFKEIVEEDYKGTLRMSGEGASGETPLEVSPSSPEAMAAIDDTIEDDTTMATDLGTADTSRVQEPLQGGSVGDPIVGREPIPAGGRLNRGNHFREPIVPDYVYDVITALQSKLEAVEVYETFIADCEAAGDSGCASLFHEICADDERHARRLADELQRLMQMGSLRERQAA